MEVILQIGMVITLVLLNGYFVASEFSLVAVRKTRINELVKKGNKAALLVEQALKDLDSYISATQLGITLASLALGWIGEPALAHFFEPFFAFLPSFAAALSAHTLAVGVAFLIITFLHIVIGELAPKTIALQRAEVTSLLIIAPLTFLVRVFRPFIWVLNGAGSLVLKVFGFKAPSGHQLVHSEEEIKMILAQSTESGVIQEKEAEMVYSVFRFGDIPIKKIMVPSSEIKALNITLSLKEIVKKVLRHPHSRFPIYKESLDNVFGFIHIKDLYREVLKSKDYKKLSETRIIRKIIISRETDRIDKVLLEMRRKRIHIAVIKDEDDKTLGMATLEDIIESLVGEIQDEFETPEKTND